MATEAVEILIRARNDARAGLDQATRQVVAFKDQATRAGLVARAQFSNIAQVAGSISPAIGSAIAPVERLAASTAGLSGLASATGLVAGALVAVGAAGLAAARNLASTVEQLDNLSAATGSSVEDLQVLQEVFARAGLGADAANNALLFLNRSIADQNKALAALGVTAKTPVAALLQIAEAFRGSGDEAAKTRIDFALMGRGSGDVLKVIQNLADSFPALRAEMQSTGQLMSGDVLTSARKLDAEWDRFVGRWKGFWQEIGHVSAVAINFVIDNLSALRNAFKGLGQLGLPFQHVGVAFAGMAAGVNAAAPKVVTSTNKINAALAAIEGPGKKAAETWDQIKASMADYVAFLQANQKLMPPELRNVPTRRPEIQVGEQVPEPAAHLSTGVAAMQAFRNELDSLTDSSLTSIDMLQAGFDGLSNGINAAFQGMLNGTATLKTAIVGVVKSMVSEILAALARLLAAKIFQIFLGLIGFGTGAALPVQALAGAAAGGTGSVALGLRRATPVEGGSLARVERLLEDLPARLAEQSGGRVTQTVSISALDAKSFDDYMNSPMGPGRLATLRRLADNGFS